MILKHRQLHYHTKHNVSVHLNFLFTFAWSRLVCIKPNDRIWEVTKGSFFEYHGDNYGQGEIISNKALKTIPY